MDFLGDLIYCLKKKTEKIIFLISFPFFFCKNVLNLALNYLV
jgi:hypothetical protein